MKIIYHGYEIIKEQDHVLVRGPSSEWREDTATDAIREINRIKGVPTDLYCHARTLRREEVNESYTRKELEEYNGME